MCDYCNPDQRDHGFDLNDCRDRWTIPNPSPVVCKGCEGGCDECCDGLGEMTAKVEIIRDWHSCRTCGIGSDFTPRFKLTITNYDGELVFSAEDKEQHRLEAALLGMFPAAERNEPEFNEDTRSYHY